MNTLITGRLSGACILRHRFGDVCFVRMLRGRIAKQVVGLLGVAVALACGTEPVTAPAPVATAMVPWPGTADQTGVAGEAAGERPGVLVTTDRGRPVAGVPVTFAVSAGGGVLSGESVTTGIDGKARVGSWTLGIRAGTNSVVATASGLPPITFTARARPGNPATLRLQGSGQIAEVGTAVATPLQATVTDALGNPVAGVDVTFFVVSGGGSVARTQGTTDTAGTVSPGLWSLGGVPGLNLLRVTAGVLSSTWGAQGKPGAPARLVAVGPTSHVVARGTTIPQGPSVRVVDQRGNGVTGVAVTFSSTGGATVHVGTSRSDSSGLVTADSVVMPATAGSATVTASSTGLGPVTFSVQGASLDDVARLYTREGNTCALTTSGIGFCWGLNDNGELGDGTRTRRLTPVGITGGLAFSDLGFANSVTCGLRATDGALFCWGRNNYGELGFPTRSANAPHAVNTPMRFRQLAGSGGTTLCGLTHGGEVLCWISMASFGLSLLEGAVRFVSIAAGGYHKCGLDANRDAWCWGQNTFGTDTTGQLGDGTGLDRTTPVRVAGGLKFISLGPGAFHSCAITSDGEAWCWGENRSSQLGDGTAINRRVPVRVATLLRFSKISGGGSHSCALTVDGEAWCWGDNTVGQLGTGSSASSAVPVRVAGSLRFREISTYFVHTCAVTTSGRTWCWGSNDYGTLGNGGVAMSRVPVAVVP